MKAIKNKIRERISRKRRKKDHRRWVREAGAEAAEVVKSREEEEEECLKVKYPNLI